jgi:hypothetical protein
MKTLKSVIVIVLILSVTAFSQPNGISSIVRMTSFPGSSWNPQLIVFTSHYFANSAWGLGNFDAVGQSWSEGFLGLLYKPNANIYAAIYGGLETAKSWRVAAESNFGWKKLSWYNWYEYGKTPACWISQLTLSFDKSWQGRIRSYVMTQGIKIGPGFSWTILNSPFGITPIVLYNSASRKLGLQVDVYANF